MHTKNPFFLAAAILLALALTVSGCGANPAAPITVGTSGSTFAVTALPAGLQVGPLPVPYQEFNYRWLAPEALGVLAGGDLRAVADLAVKKVYQVKDVGPFYDLSPDRSRLAYSTDGNLAVLELATGRVSTWSFAEGGKVDPSLMADLLTWSPDGSTIVGALYPPGKTIHNKLWSLNVTEGRLKPIGSFGQFNYFSTPIWSPDGRQLVLRRYYNGYSESSHGEWLLVDLPTGRTSRVAGPDLMEVAYDFAWGADGKVEAKPTGLAADGLETAGLTVMHMLTTDVSHARWVGDAVLYVGDNEVGLLKPDEAGSGSTGSGGDGGAGGQRLIMTTAAGDYFGESIIPSASGDQLAIPVYSPAHSTVWIEVLDLSTVAAGE